MFHCSDVTGTHDIKYGRVLEVFYIGKVNLVYRSKILDMVNRWYGPQRKFDVCACVVMCIVVPSRHIECKR
jgi:hypothetical protein